MRCSGSLGELLMRLLLLLLLLQIGHGCLRTRRRQLLLAVLSEVVRYANGNTRRRYAAPSRVFGRGRPSRCGAAT